MKTLGSLVEYVVGDAVDEGNVETLRLSTMEKLDKAFIDAEEGIIWEHTSLDSDKLREFRGIVGMKVRMDLNTDERKRQAREKIENLGIEINHWSEKAATAADERSKESCHTIAEVAELKADYVTLKINEKQVIEEVQEMVKENDLIRFDSFKKRREKTYLGYPLLLYQSLG